MKKCIFICVASVVTIALAFAGTKPVAKDRQWKIVCPSVEGEFGRAVELLTAEMGPLILRDSDLYTFRVLPVEQEGRKPVPRRHRFILGTRKTSSSIRSLVKADEVPQNGYIVRVKAENGTNLVVIAGSRPVDVIYGVADFVEDALPVLADQGNGDGISYISQIFNGSPLRAYESRREPSTPVRSLFTWGHVVDDYQLFFREMARLKLNRVILWNDFPPVNAREVVECAHSWGIAVFWGFPWGWDTDCRESGKADLAQLAESVLTDWRKNWKELPGDGIYFQTFTELAENSIAGESIAVRAVRLVNCIAAKMFSECPDLKIVFGLHAMSVKDDLAAIANVDSRLEVLWEDCGAFPWHWGFKTSPEIDDRLVDEIMTKTPNAAFAFKGQLLQDWGHWEHQSGPYMLGCAGGTVLAHDRKIASSLLEPYNDRWMTDGRRAYEIIRRIQLSSMAPKELNTVTEYNPPFEFQTTLLAELLWSSREDYSEIFRRVLKRIRKQD